ncbi:MAG: hypothetical protein AB7I42_25805 [Bradyrhizobium sp.]|uniref:hypothetical protein n=1 Tax=Bradyrhizobium sp. TaxID=376 RepID=UPI003D0A1BE6
MLIYRLLSTAQPRLSFISHVWAEPGVPFSVGPSQWLTCFFDVQREQRHGLHCLPALVTGYSLRVRYDSPIAWNSFSYEDIGSSLTLETAGLVCIPRAVESFAHGNPRRVMLDFYSLEAIERSLGL